MLNAKRRKRIEKHLEQGKPISHLVHRSRNVRFMPDAQAALRREARASQ